MLEAPIPLPGVKSPENPFPAPASPTSPSSGGFEGMAVDRTGQEALPDAREGALATTRPARRRINEFDPRRSATPAAPGSTARRPADSIGDLTQVDQHRFVVIERDNDQGAAAPHQADLPGRPARRRRRRLLRQDAAVDLHGHRRPAGSRCRRGPATSASAHVHVPVRDDRGRPAAGRARLLVVNDNNFPFSIGRNPAAARLDDFIVVRALALHGS